MTRTVQDTNTPPVDACEVCSAPPGAWCFLGCNEAPPPNTDPFREDAIAMAGMLNGIMTMLHLKVEDPGAAKNYVQFEMNWTREGLKALPFDRAIITFCRPGGLTPHDRAEVACRDALDARVEMEQMDRHLHNAVVRQNQAIEEADKLRAKIATYVKALDAGDLAALNAAQIDLRVEVRS